jgi:hypothetical protein
LPTKAQMIPKTHHWVSIDIIRLAHATHFGSIEALMRHVPKAEWFGANGALGDKAITPGPPDTPPVVTGGARAGFWPKKGVAIAHTRAILWTKISGRTLLFCEMSPRATAIAGAITSQGAFLPLGPSHRKAQYNTLRAGALRKPGLHGRRAAVLMQMVQ